MTVRRTVAVAAICALALAASGCARMEKAFTPPPKVVTKEATVAVPAAQVTGELSPDAPSDVPMWPGATVEKSKLKNDAYALTLTVPEPYKTVLPGVAAGFERDGWTVAQADSGVEGAEVSVLTVEGPAWGGIVTVTATPEGATIVDYTLTQLSK